LFSTLGIRNYDGVQVYSVKWIPNCWSCLLSLWFWCN